MISHPQPWGNDSYILTDDAIDRTEDDGHDDEPRVPIVMVVHGRHPEEHKYDSFRAAWQHFHRVFDRGVRLVRYIRLHVILHGDAAEGDPGDKGEVTVNRWGGEVDDTKGTNMARGWIRVRVSIVVSTFRKRRWN